MLTPRQRIDRLRVRIAELACWRDREYLDLGRWSFGGEPLALGAAWPRRDGVQLLEHPEVALPASWPLEESVLELDLGGEGLLTLRSGGERERFGLDPYHRRVSPRWRGFALEVEAVARLPFGVPHPDPRLATARLAWVDVELEGYVRLLELVLEAAEALAEHEAVPALLDSAERSLRGLDWPSHTPEYLARVRGQEAFARLWRPPAGLAGNPPGLTDARRMLVRAAHEHLRDELRALQSRYPPQGALRLSGHAHIDLAWLWPIEETRRKARRSFASMTALLRRYPEFTFNQSHAQYYAWLEDDDPELLDAILEHAREGRWEPIGGMWVESDTQMPTGESLARQLLYGQRYFRRRFGREHSVGWLPDCFGFSPALPQLYALAGIEAFFTTKTNWNETNRFPHDLFWWEGLDGTRLLTHTFFNERGGYNGVFDPATALSVWRHYRGKHDHPESLLTLGYGDGGGGTTADDLERRRAAEVLPLLPRAAFGRVDELFAELRRSARERGPLPVWSGEIYLELHRGVFSSQGRTKRLHRRAERALLAAEAVGGLAALVGGPTPKSLEPHWRELLKNQFHDILPGSSIGEVYVQAERELADVATAAEAAAERALADLAAAVPAGARDALLVVNPELGERPLRLHLPAAARGAQRVADGWLLSDARPVPGLAAQLRLEAAAPAGLTVSRHHLENALLRVELAADGTLASVVDKRRGREALSDRGNQLWAYVDKPRAWDAWDVDAGYREQGQELSELTACEVVEEGPHRAAVRLVRRFRDSVVTQELRLWSNSARLEFATAIDWHERHWLLQARFPLNVRAGFATFETAFGVVRRPTHANTSWDAARFEVPAHRFADLSEPGFGVALLNDGRYGHHALASELGLTLLRSPAFPDPLADEGAHALRYALLPHAGDWLAGGVLAEAEDLDHALLTRSLRCAEAGELRPLVLEGVPAALGALKPCEDGDGLVLRVYEPQGARGPIRLRLPAGWRVAGEVDLLERPLAEASPALRPFQVRSWRLERG